MRLCRARAGAASSAFSAFPFSRALGFCLHSHTRAAAQRAGGARALAFALALRRPDGDDAQELGFDLVAAREHVLRVFLRG